MDLFEGNAMRYLILTGVIGCSPSFGDKGTQNNTGNNLDVNQQDDLLQESGLPSLSDGMEENYCDNAQPGVAGATSYFMGTYIIDSDGWFGREQWILHPTPAWTATNGETCYVTWETIASQTEVAGCATCDFALQVSASINRQQTDCPEGLWEETEEQWEVTYDVYIDGSSAIFYFQNSGDELGQGHSNDTAVNFLSSASCTWF